MLRIVTVIFGFVAAMLFGGASAASAQSSSADAVARGKAVYLKAACHGCHGTVGQGGPGGRLAPKPLPSAAFTGIVRKGRMSNPRANRNWAGMPPFSAKFLSDADVADIHAYLSSIPDPLAVSSMPLLSGR